MANNWNVLRFTQFTVWILLYVAVCGAEDYSGDMPYLKAMPDLPSDLIDNLNSSFTVTANETNTTTEANESTTEMTTLVFKSTTISNTMSTDQLSSTSIRETTQEDKSESTTSSTKTTTPFRVTETTTLTKNTQAAIDKEKTELMTRLNGYKIATISLAAVLGIVFLIILIYFSARSKTGRGEITNVPGTPPQDEENVSQDEESKPVRLSSYFPRANDSLKLDMNDNDEVEQRKVTSFLTKKKPSLEEATGSRDKILHTSEL